MRFGIRKPVGFGPGLRERLCDSHLSVSLLLKSCVCLPHAAVSLSATLIYAISLQSTYMTSAKSSPYHTLAISLIRSFCSDLELYHTFNTFKVELAAYDGLEEEQLEILRTHEIQDRLGLNPQKGVPYLETVIGFLCNHLGYDGDHDREDMKRTIAAAPRGRSVETSRKGRSLSTTRMGTRSTSRSQTRQREESEDERLAISVPRHRPKAGTVGTAVMAARSSAGRGQEAKEEDIKIVGARIRSDVPAVTKSGSVVGEAKKMRAEAANLSGTSETTYEPRIGRSAVRRDDVKKGNVVPVVNELRPVMSIGSSSRRDPSVDRSRNARERNSKSIASKHESRPGTTGATLTQSSDWPEVGRNGHSGGSGLVKVNSLTSMNRFPPSPVSTGISLRPLDGFDEPSMGRSRSRPDPRTVKFERQDQDMQPAYEASHKSASQPTRPGTSHRSKNDIYVTDTVTGTPRSDAQGKDAGSRSSNRNVLYEFGRQDQDIQSVHKASHKTAPQPTRPVSSQRSHSKTDIEITDTLTGTPNSLSQVKDAGLRSPNRSVLGELGRQEQDAQPVYKSSYTAARQPSRPVTSHGSHSKNDIEITDTFTDESDSETYLSASITKLTVNHLPSLPSTYPKPLPTELAQTVHNLIWGSQRPSPAWLTARLTLNRDPVLGYGLVQEKGGPCGVLAGLQGRLIKCLLEKSGGKGRNGWAKRDCEEALVRAVAECLWKARGDVEGRVIVGM